MTISIGRRLVAWIGVLMIGAACFNPDHEPPDTTPRPELSELYEFLFNEAEVQFGRDIRADSDEWNSLARQRLINEANTLADEVAAEPVESYEIDLPFLNMPDPDEPTDWEVPTGFEVTLTAEQLVEFGVMEKDGPEGR